MPTTSPTPPEAPAQTPVRVWDAPRLADPHRVRDKRWRVQAMFAAIAPSYDLNNRLHSLGQDQHWRRNAARLARLQAGDVVVDVACGTGDLTLALHQAKQTLARSVNTPPGPTLGIDFTLPMLPLARHKARATCAPGDLPPVFLQGDAQNLPLPDDSVDLISIAFGIRNVQEVSAALREFHRVLRPGGRVLILEFSLPSNRLLRGLYNFYFRRVLPFTATLISRDRTGAYKYLPESVNTFLGPTEMLRGLEQAGFRQNTLWPMTFGVCVCYRGVKGA